MQKAQFYGSSDDLIEISGVKGGDEYTISSDETNGKTITSFNLGGQMRIHVIYDGCWSFAVGQVDEDIKLPDWPIRISQSKENGYSTCLEIDVPDNVKVFQEK